MGVGERETNGEGKDRNNNPTMTQASTPSQTVFHQEAMI